MKLVEGVYTEAEVIELTITWGFDGSEFNTKAWKDNQCLKSNNGTHQKLIKKLKTRFQNVDIEGRGKDRRYILTCLQDDIGIIDDKRKDNQRPTSDDVENITEYIFNRLVAIIGQEESKSMTKTNWYKHIGLYQVENSDIASYNNVLIETFRKHHDSISVDSMRKEVVEALKQRINYVHDYSMNKLIKAKRIEINFNYKAVASDEAVEQQFNDIGSKNKVYLLSDKSIEDIQSAEKSKVNELGVSFSDYIIARAIPKFAPKKAKEILSEMDEFLKEEFGLLSYYRELEITILDDEIIQEVSQEEARNSFVTRTVELMFKQTSKEEYINAEIYSLRFFRLNYLLFLKLKGEKRFNNQIDKELFTLRSRLDHIRDSYIKTQAGKENTRSMANDNTPSNEEVEQLFAKESEQKEKSSMKVEQLNDDHAWLNKFVSSKKVEKAVVNEERKAELKALAEKHKNNPKLIDIGAIGDENEEVEEVKNDYNPFHEQPKYPDIEVKLIKKRDKFEETLRLYGELYPDEDVETNDQIAYKLAKKRINITEIIANSPSLEGFGFEIDEQKMQESMEKLAVERRKLFKVV